MREIKFRAWNKENKQMSWPFTLYETPTWETNSGGYTLTDEEFAVAPIMQYTGLKDKNGKEIYGDDILRRSWDFKTPHGTHRHGSEIGSVEFDYSWTFNNVEGLNPAGNTPLWEINKHCEIIGNIHQDPKLLEKQEESGR